MMDNRWARWCAASINKHFETYLAQSGLVFTVFVESSKRKNADKESIIEVRHDGGYWTETTKDRWKGVYEINLEISHSLNDRNYYDVFDLIGVCCRAMSTPIALFNYEKDGTGTQIGCFNLFNEKGEIIVHNFGQIEPKIEMVQATVEAHFYVELDA